MTTETRRRPGWDNRGATSQTERDLKLASSLDRSADSRRDLAAVVAALLDIGPFARRVVQDAINEATADYWRRRARAFDAARPRRGDYPGRARRADLAAADRRCAETAEACRQHAAIVGDAADDLLGEVT